jgi:protoporphyrinogen oxidase
MGLVTAYLKVTRNWQALEQVTAHEWVPRWMGRKAYSVVWEPLLLGKFGDHYRDIPMSFLWARLHKRSARLIYFEGGFQAWADHLAAAVEQAGAEVRLGTPVTRIERAPSNGLVIHTDGEALEFDQVIATVGPHVFARMTPDLPEEYLSGIRQLKYLGAIVAIMALDRKLMPKVYWLSMDKREFPFLACVEHTNFVQPEHYGGDRLVYLGDYVAPDHRYFSMSDEELLDVWLPALKEINAEFDRSWIRRVWIKRTGYGQPVVPLGFSKHIPPIETPIPGLYLASMSQVYPWDRGTNYAVEIGRKAAALALAQQI